MRRNHCSRAVAHGGTENGTPLIRGSGEKKGVWGAINQRYTAGLRARLWRERPLNGPEAESGDSSGPYRTGGLGWGGTNPPLKRRAGLGRAYGPDRGWGGGRRDEARRERPEDAVTRETRTARESGLVSGSSAPAGAGGFLGRTFPAAHAAGYTLTLRWGLAGLSPRRSASAVSASPVAAGGSVRPSVPESPRPCVLRFRVSSCPSIPRPFVVHPSRGSPGRLWRVVDGVLSEGTIARRGAEIGISAQRVARRGAEIGISAEREG